MILRLEYIEDPLFGRYFGQALYASAMQKQINEDFAGARRLLSNASVVGASDGDEGLVPYSKGVGLYCCCCAFQQDFDELARIRSLLGDATILSDNDIHVGFLWEYIYRSNWELAFAESDQKILDAGRTVDEWLPYFYFFRGIASAHVGELETAIRDTEISQALFLVADNSHYAAYASNRLGILFRQLSKYQISLNWYERAQAYYDKLGLKRKQSMVRMNIGVTYYKMARYADAEDVLTESLAIGIKGKWLHRQCFANIALGNVRRLQRAFEDARRHLHAAYNQAQELKYPREEALALEFLGDVYRDEDQPAEARRFYARAKAIGEKLAPEGDIVMEIHRRVGECLALEGQRDAARPELDRALTMARAQGDRFEEAVTLRVLAETLAAGGDGAQARQLVDQAITILREIDAKHEAANAMLTSARLYLDEADAAQSADERDLLDQAWSWATAALDLYLHVDVAWWTEQARLLVDRIARRRAARDRAEAGGRATYAPGDVIIHTSRAMKDLLQLTDMFATSSEAVLVTGETGTGKELIARRIHQRSARASQPLVTVNVAAIPSTVFEREFFGHVRGAFSGADRDQPGFAARADGGTLFLDEIGDLPLDMQPKLLRLLQDGTYQAIGDPSERHADVRLVAATNADLAKLVNEGRFRADLWYRLRILELDLPPVRERPEDVRPLLRHFLSLAAGRPVDPAEVFEPESLAVAESWNWPGNVREIAMIARRAHVEKMTRGDVRINLLDGPRRAVLCGRSLRALVAAEGQALPGPPTTERARIVAALERCEGNRRDAARLLGLGRSTLYRKMTKLGIPTRKS